MAKDTQVEKLAEPVPGVVPSPAERVNAVVHDWFVEFVQNTPIAHEQRAYEQALVAKEALTRMILERLI